MSVLTVEDLSFELKQSSRRRTLQIPVDRSGDLVLSAPPDVEEERLREFVLEKRFWIYTKLAEKDRLQKTVPTKSYVDEINALVLDRTVEEVRQANRLWDYFAKNRNGPSELVEHFDTDTRSRWTASFFPGDWYLPDD